MKGLLCGESRLNCEHFEVTSKKIMKKYSSRYGKHFPKRLIYRKA